MGLFSKFKLGILIAFREQCNFYSVANTGILTRLAAP